MRLSYHSFTRLVSLLLVLSSTIGARFLLLDTLSYKPKICFLSHDPLSCLLMPTGFTLLQLFTAATAHAPYFLLLTTSSTSNSFFTATPNYFATALALQEQDAH